MIIINTIHISDCRQFADIHISQGSVATYLRCGGIFKYQSVANLSLRLSVKEFRKSVNIWRSYGQELIVLFFWLTVYIHIAKVKYNTIILYKRIGRKTTIPLWFLLTYQLSSLWILKWHLVTFDLHAISRFVAVLIRVGLCRQTDAVCPSLREHRLQWQFRLNADITWTFYECMSWQNNYHQIKKNCS